MPTTEEKIKKNLLLDDDEMKTIGAAFDAEKDENCTKLKSGDAMYWGAVDSKYQAFYSQRLFNNMGKEFWDKFNDGTYENHMEELDDLCLNPPFRWALSAHLKDRDDGMKSTYKKCEELLNRRMLMRTLDPVDRNKIDNYQIGLNGGKDYSQYLPQKQELMAKLLFIQQLAGVKIYQDNDSPAKFMTDENVILDTLVHGGRTSMILPKSSDTDKMFDPVVGANKGKESGLYGRFAATHSVQGKSFDGMETLKETNHKVSYSNFRYQYGMDLAVGGFGQKGLYGRTITADGSFGHMYMRLDPGDSNHYGTIMFGCEGSAAGKKNQTGQSHGISATKNKQSAFMSDKNGVGQVIGGRVIDLSNVDEKEFSSIMQAFHNSYSALQNLASRGDARAREKINKIHQSLMGKPLSKDEMVKLATGMGMDEKQIKETYIRSRVPNEAVKDEKRIKKPGLFTRIKAFFNVQSAKREVEAYRRAKEELEQMPDKLKSALEENERNEKEHDKVYENRLQSSLDLLEMTDEKIPEFAQNKNELFSVIKGFKNGGSDTKEFLKHYYTGKFPVELEYSAIESELRDQYKSKEVQELIDGMTNAMVSLHKNMCTNGSDGTEKDLTSMVLSGKMIGKLLGMTQKYPVLLDTEKMGNIGKQELENCVKIANRIEDAMRSEGFVMLQGNGEGQTVGLENAKKIFIGKSLETLIQKEHGFSSIIKNYDALVKRMDKIASDSNNSIVQELSNMPREAYKDAYKKEGESFWEKNKEALEDVLNPKAAKQKEIKTEAKEKEITSVKQAEKHEEKKVEKASGKIM